MFRLLLALVLCPFFVSEGRAQLAPPAAQPLPGVTCPPSATGEECERLALRAQRRGAAEARRQGIRAEREQKREETRDFRRTHPVRVGAAGELSLVRLRAPTDGDPSHARLWGLGVGGNAFLQLELATRFALRGGLSVWQTQGEFVGYDTGSFGAGPRAVSVSRVLALESRLELLVRAVGPLYAAALLGAGGTRVKGGRRVLQARGEEPGPRLDLDRRNATFCFGIGAGVELGPHGMFDLGGRVVYGLWGGTDQRYARAFLRAAVVF